MKKYIIIFVVVLILAIIILGTLFYNGILWFVYPENMGYTVKGIDVAIYQGDIDWGKIASQKIQFAFIKATEGSSWVDPKFYANIVSSRDNGIYVGAYHFFSSESAGKTQAENFIETVSPYKTDLPPVLDFEIPKSSKEKEKVIKEARVFLQKVEEYFEVKPIIYTTYESYNAFLVNEFDDYPLWFRDLFGKPKISGNRHWLFWQYCNRGRLDGIDKKQKYTDLNIFNWNMSDFFEYLDDKYDVDLECWSSGFVDPDEEDDSTGDSHECSLVR